jgi:arginine decarboxylase
MKNKYIDLIEQTFEFPQEEFKVIDNELYFHDICLMDIIKQYGTPLKISYLPKISQQIQKAKRLFNVAMARVDYKGSYNYCYCTKSSHFSHVLEEALKNDIHIETSSAFDLYIVEELYNLGLIDKTKYVVCNGFKRPLYTQKISELVNNGFFNTIPVLDNKSEIKVYHELIEKDKSCQLGIRIASEEEPMFEFYTSRLGIRYNDIVPFYKENIANDSRFQLKMLHFFINTGIKDNAYYWNELSKCVNVYCELKKICPELDTLNIGGGFPIKNSLGFEFDYEYITEEIVAQIKNICNQNDVLEPHIFTEFGAFTVGESGAVLYSILDQKQQNDREHWNMIDSSFMTTIPDIWASKQRFILLAINNWDHEYQRVNLGGLTCDSMDYYNAELHANAIFLPKIKEGDTQYIGMFHTGAYQESLGGFGGIQHCLIPAPKLVIIDKDEEGEYTTKLFAKEQSYKSMLKTLGF